MSLFKVWSEDKLNKKFGGGGRGMGGFGIDRYITFIACVTKSFILLLFVLHNNFSLSAYIFNGKKYLPHSQSNRFYYWPGMNCFRLMPNLSPTPQGKRYMQMRDGYAVPAVARQLAGKIEF